MRFQGDLGSLKVRAMLTLHDVIVKGEGIPQIGIAITPNQHHSRYLVIDRKGSDDCKESSLAHERICAHRDFGQFVGFDRDGNVSVLVNVLHAIHSIHYRCASRGLERLF